MTANPHTLVVGAQGNVGAELVRLLVARGHRVRRATRRSPTEADQVHLDLATKHGVPEAVRGIDCLFTIAPPGHTNQHELLNPLIDAARGAGVAKVVLMSGMGADGDVSAPLRRAELHLQDSDLAWNVIRPNWFMQNFNTYWLKGIVEQGTIFLPVGGAKASFIDGAPDRRGKPASTDATFKWRETCR